MKREITEACQLENGFTEKGITIFNNIFSQVENNGQCYENLLVDLRKRFFWGYIFALCYRYFYGALYDQGGFQRRDN
ncbi:hypothetical protein [Erwinia oleae]|uniref:hypothetical protein n=1 Tax=Erwinia oleae TaxID=796334 RepID=UPI0005579BE4|nr:hypothetical protein [Erwinia oleae]